ncbi:MAG: immune inhibitor A [Chloroflexi bacterium]|nr:immune inhibitor A [Chloroflexota bacterium]
MRVLHKRLAVLISLSLLFSLSGALAGGAAAVKPIRDAAPRHDQADYNNGVKLPIVKGDNLKGNPPLGPAKVGESRIWLGLNDFTGSIYLKFYTLRAVGNHAEVWVANNLDFPTVDGVSDCRNDGVRNVVTDEQVGYLIDEFDNNMYPIESDWWGVPPARNGNKAVLPKVLPNIRGLGVNIPQSYYRGEGDNIVVLVDNVRDSNYYDFNNANTNSYIAGFYYSVFDEYFDRTVMSIDAWDWIHRTGADPAHDPSGDPCTSAPARPFLYEGVFAHEYQHLIHHYSDPDEVTWVNEGLSDFTEVITGYVDLSKHVDEKGYESHTNAFLGWGAQTHPDWNPLGYESGPENGLPAWEDQGGDEVLADYGFAMFFMNFVNSQGFGRDFFHAWHHTQADGIAGMNAALAAAGSGDTFAGLFSDVIVSALVDGYIDNGAPVSGDATAADLQNAATEATVLINADANGTTGAPQWGSDYIDLGPGAGLTSVAFNGDDEFVFPAGPQWVVDADGYFTNPDVADGLYDNNQDLSIARSVAGHDGEVLSFDHYYATEIDWDFGFVQVSTDDGATWQSLACDGTTTAHDPGAIGSIVANLPGYSGEAGSAGAPLHATCPALPAGSDLIAFRLMTDPAVQLDGWHVKNVQLNGADLGTAGSLTGWDNQGFFSPLDLGFAFAVVGINGTVDIYGDVTAGSGVTVLRPTLDAGNAYTLSAGDLAALAGYDRVIAIVTGIPDSEDTTIYGPYSLLVNGAERADGA